MKYDVDHLPHCVEVTPCANTPSTPAETAETGNSRLALRMRENYQSIKDPRGGARDRAGRKLEPKRPAPDPWPKSPGRQWHVVSTFVQAERLVAEQLTDAGYKHYLPFIVVSRRDANAPGVVHRVRVPRFTGYVFSRFDYDRDPWGPINQLPGVRGVLVSTTGRPLAVPDTFITWLVRAETTGLQAPPAVAMPPLEAGSKVRIDYGGLAEHRGGGTVISCDGVTTMIEVWLFGRSIEVAIERSALRAIVGGNGS